MTTPLHSEANDIVRVLRRAGYETYFAGGCVRDMVMGIEPHDFDIATSARPEEIKKLFPRTSSVGAAFGVILLHRDAGDFEVATFRADAPSSDGRHPESVTFCSAREDVLRRDFTINGMFYDPESKQVLDWVRGQEDIRARTIRAIGDPDLRFEEDKLRLLRAVRFAARFDYSIEGKTYDAICRTAPRLGEVSLERIRDELVRIFTGSHAGRGLRLMHDMGLLQPILPEVEALSGVEQPPQFHPEGDVMEHTCMMLDEARSPSTELAMALLLHDIGKPSTQSFRERIRFDEHDAAGEVIAGDICRRLRFSNEQIERIVSLVGNHMRFGIVQKMKLSTLKRLLALPHFEEHLELHCLDCLASHRKLDNYEFLIRRRQELSEEEIAPVPLINGYDLIEMGFKPGPIFQQILDAAMDEQLEGRLTDRESAVEWVKGKFSP